VWSASDHQSSMAYAYSHNLYMLPIDSLRLARELLRRLRDFHFSPYAATILTKRRRAQQVYRLPACYRHGEREPVSNQHELKI